MDALVPRSDFAALAQSVYLNPSWAKLVHTAAADLGEGVAEVVG